MENQSDGVEFEQITDAFTCCVCLDLLYKPIVLACGHVLCFWCVHKSMNGLHESRCPICRHPYYHFPTICQMLYFLLVKMYPITYKRRENQILEYEKKMKCFSPNIDRLVHASCHNEELNNPSDIGQSSNTSCEDNLPSDSCEGKVASNMEQPELLSISKAARRKNQKQISVGSFEASSFTAVEEKKSCDRNSDGKYEVSIADVLCAACKQLLFRPAVLNCGHVFCETCIVIPVKETLRCQICCTPHPGGLPKVCLELYHFLEEQFPEVHALRRATVQLKQVQPQPENPTTCSVEAAKESSQLSLPTGENFITWWSDRGSKVHIGVGCDTCGMYPIIGNRYRCKDCVEAIGFDQCGDCYNTRSKLPGRFNQQHTPEHRFEIVRSNHTLQHWFEIVRSNSIRNIMLRLLRGQLEDVSAAPALPSAAINPENVIPPVSNDAEDNAENIVGPIVASNGDEEDQADENRG